MLCDWEYFHHDKGHCTQTRYMHFQASWRRRSVIRLLYEQCCLSFECGGSLSYTNRPCQAELYAACYLPFLRGPCPEGNRRGGSKYRLLHSLPHLLSQLLWNQPHSCPSRKRTLARCVKKTGEILRKSAQRSCLLAIQLGPVEAVALTIRHTGGCRGFCGNYMGSSSRKLSATNALSYTLSAALQRGENGCT